MNASRKLHLPESDTIVSLALLLLYEKPYFPSPGISSKAQKNQVNLLINFLAQKKTIFPISGKSKTRIFQ